MCNFLQNIKVFENVYTDDCKASRNLYRHIDLIVLAFGRPEVTRAAVEDALAIEDVVPFTRDLFGWLQAQTFAKLVKLPNAAAGKEGSL